MELRRLSSRLGLPAAFVLGALSVVAGPAAMRDAQGAPPTTVAVIDMDKVLKAYPGAEARLATLQALVTKTEEELKALSGTVDEGVARRAGFEPKTEAYDNATMEIELTRLRFEETKKIKEAYLARKRLEISVGLWDEIVAGIGAFSKAKGIDVVLRARNAPANASASQRFEVMQARDVIWFDPVKVDATEQAIAFLKSWQPGR